MVVKGRLSCDAYMSRSRFVNTPDRTGPDLVRRIDRLLSNREEGAVQGPTQLPRQAELSFFLAVIVGSTCNPFKSYLLVEPVHS